HPVSDHNVGIRIGGASFHVERTLPCLSRFGQFRSRTATLWKHPDRLFCGQMRGYLKQSRQRGDSAGGNHVESAREPLDLRLTNGDAVRQAELLGRVTKEIGSEPPRLDEGYRPLDQKRDDQSRQAGAGSNV